MDVLTMLLTKLVTQSEKFITRKLCMGAEKVVGVVVHHTFEISVNALKNGSKTAQTRTLKANIQYWFVRRG